MTQIHHTATRRPDSRLPAGLKTLLADIAAFADAMLWPGKIIDEVKEMQRLRAEADRIAATAPAQAEALRRRAALIGLR